jgi:hypothetical protein
MNGRKIGWCKCMAGRKDDGSACQDEKLRKVHGRKKR